MSLLGRLYRIARSNLGRPSREPATFSDRDASTDDPSDTVAAAHDSDAARYYANLELAPGASFREIKAAYRRLLREYHPDKHYQDTEKSKIAEEISKGLNEAMEYFAKKHEGGRL